MKYYQIYINLSPDGDNWKSPLYTNENEAIKCLEYIKSRFSEKILNVWSEPAILEVSNIKDEFDIEDPSYLFEELSQDTYFQLKGELSLREKGDFDSQFTIIRETDKVLEKITSEAEVVKLVEEMKARGDLVSIEKAG